MPILKQVVADNGSTPTYHVPKTLTMDFRTGEVLVHVVSYIDAATFDEGKPLSWNWMNVAIPRAGLADVEQALISTASSPFFGGAIASVTTPLSVARQVKQMELNAACQGSIYSGFDSDALGVVHRYGADPQDQANLVASVLDSKLDNPEDWVTAFKCAGPDGVREYKMHTAAQIQQVGKDGKASITACLLKNEYLIAAVNAAETIEDVNVVNWNAP